MSGLNYQIQRRAVGKYKLHTYTHSFNYEFCKRKYLEYALMSIEEFTKCLRDSVQLGEIQHLSIFILWVKNPPQNILRNSLGDYGLLHLLAHCVGNQKEAEAHAEYIHELFKEDVKLV